MVLTVDLQKKKDLTRLVIRSTKKLNAIRIISKIFVLLSVVLSIIFLAVNLIFPELNEVNVNGVPTMNMLSVISDTVMIFVICLFVAVIMHYLLANLSGKDMNERACESLIFGDNSIRYIFRTRYQTALEDRIVFSIPYNDVNTCEYNKNLQRIKIKGAFSSDVVENYEENSFFEPRSKNQKEIVIYDYFNPGLLKQLETKIKIMQEEI